MLVIELDFGGIGSFRTLKVLADTKQKAVLSK